MSIRFAARLLEKAKLFILVSLTSVLLAGCSVFGDNGVDSAPFVVLNEDVEQSIQIRNYDSMVLVSADMSEDGRNSAFRKLFKYISGENEGSREIAMTAPVFMDNNKGDEKGTEIAMTAPVFMSANASSPQMSFVMPSPFTLETTPKPKDPSVTVSELKNYKVATIKFSGTLSQSNTAKNTKILQSWLSDNNLRAISEPITAGYNGPLTLPMFRHNEVLIEVE